MSATIREQDDLIGQLQVGVSKLHERAVTINDESTLHSQLLDNMDADMDGAVAGLRQETKYANAVRKESGVCWYYIAIFVLFAVMIMLIVIGAN